MIKKQPLNPERVRKTQGSFAFIEHRFLRHGFYEKGAIQKKLHTVKQNIYKGQVLKYNYYYAMFFLWQDH